MTISWKSASMLAIIGLSSIALSACSRSSNGGDVALPPPPPPPPPMAAFEDQFGDNFAAAFRNDPTAEPNAVASGDVIAIDKTIDPEDVPDPA